MPFYSYLKTKRGRISKGGRHRGTWISHHDVLLENSGDIFLHLKFAMTYWILEFHESRKRGSKKEGERYGFWPYGQLPSVRLHGIHSMALCLLHEALLLYHVMDYVTYDSYRLVPPHRRGRRCVYEKAKEKGLVIGGSDISRYFYL